MVRAHRVLVLQRAGPAGVAEAGVLAKTVHGRFGAGDGYCGSSYGVLQCVDRQLARLRANFSVIHWNWGLHDICPGIYRCGRRSCDPFILDRRRGWGCSSPGVFEIGREMARDRLGRRDVRYEKHKQRSTPPRACPPAR